MKTFVVVLLMALSFPAFAKEVDKIDVACNVGSKPTTVVTLRECVSEKTSSGYGKYSCSGKINDSFSVTYTGFYGQSEGTVLITYLPMKFTGSSWIQIGDVEVECRSVW